MLFFQALRSALLGTFSFNGRSDRLEHWTFAFLTAVICVGYYMALQLGLQLDGPVMLIGLILAAWLLIAHVSLFVRRLHDNNRTGLYMLLPAAAASTWLLGWLGMNGYVDYQHKFFLDYGVWVMRLGRIACGMCGSLLLWIFLSEGDADENIYGDPPL